MSLPISICSCSHLAAPQNSSSEQQDEISSHGGADRVGAGELPQLCPHPAPLSFVQVAYEVVAANSFAEVACGGFHSRRGGPAEGRVQALSEIESCQSSLYPPSFLSAAHQLYLCEFVSSYDPQLTFRNTTRYSSELPHGRLAHQGWSCTQAAKADRSLWTCIIHSWFKRAHFPYLCPYPQNSLTSGLKYL